MVEVDETFLGGSMSGARGSGALGETMGCRSRGASWKRRTGQDEEAGYPERQGDHADVYPGRHPSSQAQRLSPAGSSLNAPPPAECARGARCARLGCSRP